MDHVATVRRMYEQLSAGDVDGFAGSLAEDFVEHEETPGLTPTKDGVLSFFRAQIAAFPDMRMAVEDTVAEGDKVVARVRYTGTQRGDFQGMPASGKAVDAQLIDIFRFDADGRIAEHWGVMDLMAMMQQLGVVPGGPV